MSGGSDTVIYWLHSPPQIKLPHTTRSQAECYGVPSVPKLGCVCACAMRVCLECMRVTSRLLNMTLDLVRAIPDTLNVVVDPMRVTPDTLNMTLDPVGVIPDTLNVVVDPMRVTPDTLNMTLDLVRATPDTLIVVVDPMRVTPGYTEHDPGSSGGDPRHSACYPESTE